MLHQKMWTKLIIGEAMSYDNYQFLRLSKKPKMERTLSCYQALMKNRDNKMIERECCK